MKIAHFTTLNDTPEMAIKIFENRDNPHQLDALASKVLHQLTDIYPLIEETTHIKITSLPKNYETLLALEQKVYDIVFSSLRQRDREILYLCFNKENLERALSLSSFS